MLILTKLDVREFVGTADAFRATVLLFELYGLATCALTYLLSFAFKSASTAQNSVIFLNVSGGSACVLRVRITAGAVQVICMFLIMGSFVMSQLSVTCHANLDLQYVFSFIPAYALGFGLIKLAFLTFLGEWASICDPGTSLTAHKFIPLEMNSALFYVVYLGATAAGYFVCTIILDIMMSNPSIRIKAASLLSCCRRAPSTDSGITGPSRVEDDDVVFERNRVLSMPPADELLLLKVRACVTMQCAASSIHVRGPAGNNEGTSWW